MSWPGESEHRNLYVTATSLNVLLAKMPGALRHIKTHHLFHSDAAERCKSLAITLESAVMLCERDAYAPALALLRTALEQTLVDKLVFSGQRHVRIFTGVTEEAWLFCRSGGWGFLIKWGARRAPSTFLSYQAQERSWTGRRAPYEDIAGSARGREHGGGGSGCEGHWWWSGGVGVAGPAQGRAGAAVCGVPAAMPWLRPAAGAAVACGGPGYGDGVAGVRGGAGVVR